MRKKILSRKHFNLKLDLEKFWVKIYMSKNVFGPKNVRLKNVGYKMILGQKRFGSK